MGLFDKLKPNKNNKDFFEWLDLLLKNELSSEIKAIIFNLYEDTDNKWSIELGKPVNPSLHVGICGEHGGDPSSVEFCNKIGLDYVSCSPFRVPIARLAAAQAAINQK